MSDQLEVLSSNDAQWTRLRSVIAQINKKELKPFVLLSLKELEGNPDSRMSIITQVDKFAAIRTVVRHLARLRGSIKATWKPSDLKTFLDSLRFTPECSQELAQMLCVDEIYASIPKHLTVRPGLSNIDWKIDISLCQVNLKSEMSETEKKTLMARDIGILLQLDLTDGSSTVYRLSYRKFHELRFTIASILKNMIITERRKAMRRDVQ